MSDTIPITLRGHEVLDSSGDAVGTITDVIYDNDRSPTEPSWLVVNPGFFRAAHYVPTAGAYATATDQVVVPFDKRWIKAAPKASGDHVITAPQRRELEVHYNLL